MTRWVGWLIAVGLLIAVGVTVRHAMPHGASRPRELWLSDFEVDGEYAVRWTISGTYATPTTEHVTHGRHAAAVTFLAGDMPAFIMDRFLADSPQRQDWRPYTQLSFDVYNPRASQEQLILQVRSHDEHSFQRNIPLPAQTTTHVTVPLAEMAADVDLSHIVELRLLQLRSRADTTFFLDAVRLEANPSSPAVVGMPHEGTASEPDIARPDLTTVTPEILGGLQFAHTSEQWRTISPVSHQSVIRVPLTLVGPTEVPLSARFSVSGGVPFAMGQLQPSAAVRVSDASGAVMPVQTRPLATWQDGSVKWLLVTAQTPPAFKERQLWLEYGPQVTRDPITGPIVSVQESGDAIQVTTGPMRFSVSKRHFTLFDSAFIDRNHDGRFTDDERLAGDGDLVLTHNHTEYRSSQDTQTYQLVVEESGPLRATLKASGWFRDRSGNGFCQFTVRLQAFAGLSQVRVYHTFIYTGYPANKYNYQYRGIKLPDNETIQDIRLELPTRVMSDATAVSADEHEALSTALDAPLVLSQYASDHYALRKGTATMREGEHANGWLLLQNATGGVQAALRDAWQQYPNELSADPTSGRLVMKLWPDAAGELDLQTGPEAIGPDDVARGSAFGLGKTHELVFGFMERPVEAAAAQVLIAPWLQPWVLAAHPAWLQATDVLGALGPIQLDRFPEQEVLLDDLFGWAERQPKNFAWYGMLNYGDTLTWYRQEAYDTSYDDWGWHPEGRWGWHNCEAVGSHGGALISFIRSHNLKYFRFAEAKTRHVMDVDTVHYNTVAHDARLTHKISDEFSKVGSMHRHSAYHWSGRNEEATHTNVVGLLLYYYLTGYDRAYDVANEVGSFLLQDPVTYTEHPEIAPLRAIANVVWGDVLLYEATWDTRYRKAADRWVKVLLRGQQEKDGTWLETYNPRTTGWVGEVKTNYITLHTLPALIAYHRLTGQPEVGTAIVKATDAMLAKEPYLPFFDALTYSFQLTGKGEYVDTALRRLRDLVRLQRHGEDPIMRGMVFQKASYDTVGPLLYSGPFAIGGMDAFDFPTLEKNLTKEIQEQRQETRDKGHVTAQPVSRLSSPASGPTSYDVLIMSSVQKVLPESGALPGAHPNPAMLSLARNEYETVQLVLRSGSTALQQVTVEPSTLTSADGAGTIPAHAISWSPVGFVKTRKSGYAGSPTGWWPDPLPAPNAVDVKPNWTQPIWLTVYAAPGTPAGTYTGTVTIRPANAPAHEVKLVVKVWDFELPKIPSLKSAFDLYPGRIRKAYSEFFPQWWSRWEGKSHELEQRFYDDLVRHRLAPVLNADVADPHVTTSLRQWREQGLSTFGIGHFGGSFGNNWPEDATQLEALQPLYRSYGYELRTAGLLDAHYIYTYDEPELGLPKVASVARMIHAADPGLKNLVVLQASPDVERLREWLSPMDIVVLYNRAFDPAQAQRLQQMGKQVWLYVAGPQAPFPTLVIDEPGMDARILPWMCWKYGLKGLLYWSVNFWTTNPYQEPMNTPWEQNGNGSLYYPGPEGPVASIRLDVLRDGMEDYEYLTLLQQLVARVKADATMMADQKTQALIAHAESLLAVDPRLVASMKEYSRDPDVLATQRQAIAETIEQLQTIVDNRSS